MSDIQLYLLEADKNKKEATATAQRSAQRLESKDLKLIDLIESLGEYINSEDGPVRSKTMSYVAEVLQATAPKVLSGQQRNLLCDFILSRISDDNEGIGSCAKALSSLEELGKWDAIRAAGVMKTMIENTNPLSQYKLQSERYPVLLLIDRLVAKYRSAIHTVHLENLEFLPSFIAYFDGEKDPRNLMVVFSILQVPMTEWDISIHAQDLFDAAFNYFPITFRPPPDDPYGITAQDLKDRLRSCISASADFAPYSFPALLEKLDSTSINTKRDVLQALHDCAVHYGPHTIHLYSVTLWDALKFEVLHVQEEDLAEEALKTLAAIAATLSASGTEPLTNYLKPVVKECNEHLEDAPTKQSQAANRMLNVISAASPRAANFIATGVLPNLFLLYKGSENLTKRRGLLECLGQLLRANCEVFGEWRHPSKLITNDDSHDQLVPEYNSIEESKQPILDILTDAFSFVEVKEVSFRLTLLDCLLQMSKLRGVLADREIANVIKIISDVVLVEESHGKDEMKTAAIDALAEIAHQKPQSVVDNAFPAFFAKLPDNPDEGPESYVALLEAFAKLGSEPKVSSTVILRLMNKFTSAVQSGAASRYLEAILSAILYAFCQITANADSSPDYARYFSDLVKPLIKSVSVDVQENRQTDAIFYLVGRIANIVLRTLPVDFQRPAAEEILTLYLGKDTGSQAFIDPSMTASQCRTLIISTYILAALRKETPPPGDLQTFLVMLTKVSLREDLTVGTQTATLQAICLTLNKYLPASSIKTTLDPVANPSMDLLNPRNLSNLTIRTAFAIYKALILRNAPSPTQLVQPLLASLSDPKHGRTVAHGFSTLLQPDELLTKANHCTISALHAQKTFATLVPQLTSGYRAATADSTTTKANYLVALAGILRWLPYSVIADEVPSLTPLLLLTLDLDNEPAIKAGTVDTLSAILEASPKSLEEHAGSLIGRLLGLADGNASATGGRKGTAQSVEVRAKALRCLKLVCERFRREVAVPFRRQVVKRLVAALDDGRRGVRAEAVRCRAKWIELDEVGDEDDD